MDEQEKAQAEKEKSNLRQRILTGAVYIAVLFAFFLLKLLVWVPYPQGGDGAVLRIGTLLFDIIVLAFAAIGTWEMLRAFRDKLHISQKIVVMVFALLVIVTYSVSDFIFADILGVRLPPPVLGEPAEVVGRNYSMHFTFAVFLTGIAVLLSFLVFRHEKTGLESTGYALLSLVYPSFFLVVLSVCNHLESYSELAVMFIFIICPFADTFAFLFGKLFGKKLPAKMAPNISPKKTLIGGFGGLIGGAIGAVVIFFCWYGISSMEVKGIISLGYQLSLSPLNFLFFISLGVLTSAFSQFGDLVESAIKRKLGIKDMGKLLPGHGGILDRIDSSLYAGLIVAGVMVVRIMIVG